MKRTAIPLLIAFIFLLIPPSSSPLPAAAPRGILVRPQNSIQTGEDIDRIINLCEKYDITTIFLMVKQDTGPESGLVYYNSAKIPRISDFDILFSTVQKAHPRNIKVYAWVPLLYDKRASDMEFGIGNDWVSPVESLPYYSDLVKEITLVDVDGILFDYLRFPDDFASSEQMKNNFGQKFGYNMNTVELAVEKERATKLWSQWISYRNDVLSDFLKTIMPQTLPVGVTAKPEDLSHLNSTQNPFAFVNFVAAQTGEALTPMINTLTLSTNAQIYVILPNQYVSQVRELLSESYYADSLIFDSETWDELDFQRIRKAEVPFSDVRMTRLTFIDFYNNKYTMEKWKSFELNTVVLPAGHVFWTYFKYTPYQEKWSAYTQKYNRDFVSEMILQAQKTEMYTVLSLDVQSEEYVAKYKDAASITYQWVSEPTRVCLTELNREPYKTEFFEMARYVADNYESEAVLITNISYLEDCYCTDCLESYTAYMAQKNVTVGDWPRKDGEIDLYDRTIGEWKTAQITSFLGELREYLRECNKELWVEVPVSASLEYESEEYGLYLPEVEKVVDRVVLIESNMTGLSRIKHVAQSMTLPKMYVLCFPLSVEKLPMRTDFFDSLKVAYENGTVSMGVYPHSAFTDTLGAAFYIAYSYRLALTDEGLMEIYNLGDYGSVISTYLKLTETKKEEESQVRERARQNITEAERSYLEVLNSLDEARQVDLNVAAIEAEIQSDLSVLGEAKTLFIEGSYQLAEEKGKTAIIEFSTLSSKVSKMVRDERIKRVTSGALLLVVFLLIMMYIRFKMRNK